MQLTFCEKYGIDAKSRQSRLAVLGLSEQEHKLASQLQQTVIARNLNELVENFFRFLQLDDEVNRIFLAGFRQQKLEEFLKQYLTSLGVAFDQGRYFELRLRMGIAHINVGINFSTFQAAYRLLQQLLIDAIADDNKSKNLLIAFVIKITNLDLIIASEAYQHYQLNNVHNEKNVTDSVAAQPKLLSPRQLDELLVVNNATRDNTSSQSVALVIIDGFSNIEQCYGEKIARQVQQGVSARLLADVRPSDGIARSGAAQFVVHFSDTNVADAELICQRLSHKIAMHPIAADKMTIPVTISIFLTPIDDDDSLPMILESLNSNALQLQSSGVNRLESIKNAASGD